METQRTKQAGTQAIKQSGKQAVKRADKQASKQPGKNAGKQSIKQLNLKNDLGINELLLRTLNLRRGSPTRTATASCRGRRRRGVTAST